MDAVRIVNALGALAHLHRLAVYRLLVEQGPDGLPAGVIGNRVGLVPSSLTFHLQSLQGAGLVTQRRAGRQLMYAADFGAMNGLVDYLTRNCCGGAQSCEPACKPACKPGKATATKTRARPRSGGARRAA